MLILAIDCSGATSACALHDGETMIAERFHAGGQTHSETFLPMIVEMMDSVGVKPLDLTGIAVTIGPGAFTGVRIGLATAQALAYPDLPCVGVSTLEVMAQSAAGEDGRVYVARDARRDEAYTACFIAKDGVIKRMCNDHLMPKVTQTDEHISSCASGKLTKVIDVPITGAMLCAAVMPYFERGETVSVDQLQPNYVRKSQAERES